MPIDTRTRYLFDSRVHTPLGSIGGAAIYQNSRWDFEGPRTIYYYSITYILEGRCLYTEPTLDSHSGAEANAPTEAQTHRGVTDQTSRLRGVTDQTPRLQTSRLFTPGDLFFCFPGIPHRIDPMPGEEFSEMWVAFQGRFFDTWRETEFLSPDRLSLRLEPVDYWLGRFEALFANVRQDKYGQIMLMGALQSLMAEAMSIQPAPSMTADELWLSQAKELIEGVFRASDLDLPSIAGQMGMSYSTFRRRFTALAGMSPGKYHAVKLMQRICEWLHTSNAATREAAEWFGFADESHFYKRFRDIVGISPRQFRERLQRDRMG